MITRGASVFDDSRVIRFWDDDRIVGRWLADHRTGGGDIISHTASLDHDFVPLLTGRDC